MSTRAGDAAEAGGSAPTIDKQTVLITGAAQGLGAAIARHFHGLGARLLLLDRNAVGLAEVQQACPGATTVVVDLADAEATDRALAQLPTAEIDTLIHNAALLRIEPLAEVTLANFQAAMDVGIQAGFQLTQATWDGMRERGGTLIYVSSRSGIEGFAEETAYCAAKHALEGFSKCVALEGSAHQILSVTVTPGMYMRTPMSEVTYPPELREKWVDPLELAPAFSYLAARPMHLSGQRLSAWDLAQDQHGR